jgi:hypothetical protein
MFKMVLKVESQYFAPLNVYLTLGECTHCDFNAYEDYRKMSFRNRCTLLGASGTIDLSVPIVDGRNQRNPLREVRIDNRQRWQTRHWRTITSCYRRSPWFEFYELELGNLYEQNFEFLYDWNLACFEWTMKILGWKIEVIESDKNHEIRRENLIDLRDKILPKNRANTNGGFLKYSQVFEERQGFVPNLSILDLLFCEGKNASELLKNGGSFPKI